MKKCVIIKNPESGKLKKLPSSDEVYDTLLKYGYNTEIKYTKKKKDATEIIKSLPDDIDLVISAGGDGTLNEVVTGNEQRKKNDATKKKGGRGVVKQNNSDLIYKVFFLKREEEGKSTIKFNIANLPMGTTNDVGNMYGFTRNNYKNLEILLKGVKKKIDVCFIDKTPFIYVACLGDYIDMAYNTPRDLKKKYGKVAYALYGLKQITNKINRYKVRYKIDGKEYTGEYSFFFITNSSRVAGVDDIYYDVKLNDNMFEVAFADLKTKKDILRTFFQITNNDVKSVKNITYYQTDNLEIEFLDKQKTSWCIDGEEYKSENNIFKFSVKQDQKMLMPKENINKLFKENDEKK